MHRKLYNLTNPIFKLTLILGYTNQIIAKNFSETLHLLTDYI